MLLSRQANVRAKAHEGGTSWILANISGDKKILDLLISAGAGARRTE
ncbi:MAG: hypothetical protein WCO26_25300, partial [Deltaproteobacteria bacterium]